LDIMETPGKGGEKNKWRLQVRIGFFNVGSAPILGNKLKSGGENGGIENTIAI